MEGEDSELGLGRVLSMDMVSEEEKRHQTPGLTVHRLALGCRGVGGKH